MTTKSLLATLRGLSAVDCDTLDSDVAKSLGPFIDCTSNQAIAYAELVKKDSNGESFVHEKLIKESIRDAHWMVAKQPNTTLEELAVEIMMVRLALNIVPHLSGFSHIQTNPKYSYSTEKTVKNAERIVSLFKELSPDFDAKRVCIKIPSTWEGLQACRELEKRGIATLATTLFCMEQAALAGDAGCTYIAPYVNELKVHFVPGYKDMNKAFSLCGQAQRYYRARGIRTKVLPASLTSIEEVMMLAGADHITISPPLLRELESTSAESFKGEIGSVFEKPEPGVEALQYHLSDESDWRLSFTRSGGGTSENKIIQAINTFSDMQDQLEALVRDFDTAA